VKCKSRYLAEHLSCCFPYSKSGCQAPVVEIKVDFYSQAPKRGKKPFHKSGPFDLCTIFPVENSLKFKA